MARLSHWILPALFPAVAFAVDGAHNAARRAYLERQWRRLAGPALVILSLVMLVPYAKASIAVIKPAADTDDRAGAAFIKEHFRTGDIVFMTGTPSAGFTGTSRASGRR